MYVPLYLKGTQDTAYYKLLITHSAALSRCSYYVSHIHMTAKTMVNYTNALHRRQSKARLRQPYSKIQNQSASCVGNWNDNNLWTMMPLVPSCNAAC